MKDLCRSILLSAILLLLSNPGQAEDAAALVLSSTTKPIHLPRAENKAFEVGEKLEFNIHYQFIDAGEATLEVQEGSLVMGRRTFNILSTAKSNSFIDVFFPVRDINGSMTDRDSLASITFHQNLHEGHYKVIRNTTIQYDAGKYEFTRYYKGQTQTSAGPITQPVHDILSAFYLTRTLALIPGGDYEFPVFSDGELYPLDVKVDPQIETIRVKAGKFECLKVTPIVVGDTIFQASKGKMTIWMTNDARKMPVLIRSKAAIGAFDAELTRYSPK